MGVYELSRKCYWNAFHLVIDKCSFELVINICIGNKILISVCFLINVKSVMRYLLSRRVEKVCGLSMSVLLSLSVGAALKGADIEID